VLKKVTVEKIAKTLNVSKASVSKALNNTGVISYKVKKKILDLAAQEGYEVKNESTDIGIVMPYYPKMFWQTYLSEMLKCSKKLGLTSQNFLYKDDAYPEDVIVCLDAAEKADIDVLIVGITCSIGVPQIMERIKELNDKMLVIFVEEIYRDDAQVYVGEHSYESARQLASTYLKKHPDRDNFITFSKGGHSIGSRVDGFRDELTLRDKTLLDVLEFPSKSSAVPANIARIINKYNNKYGQVGCVFCASGSISDVCVAIRKLKLDIHCIGFESTNADMAYFDAGILKCVARQNIPLQAQAAIDIAYRYVSEGIRPNILKGESHKYIEDYFVSN